MKSFVILASQQQLFSLVISWHLIGWYASSSASWYACAYHVLVPVPDWWDAGNSAGQSQQSLSQQLRLWGIVLSDWKARRSRDFNCVVSFWTPTQNIVSVKNVLRKLHFDYQARATKAVITERCKVWHIWKAAQKKAALIARTVYLPRTEQGYERRSKGSRIQQTWKNSRQSEVFVLCNTKAGSRCVHISSCRRVQDKKVNFTSRFWHYWPTVLKHRNKMRSIAKSTVLYHKKMCRVSWHGIRSQPWVMLRCLALECGRLGHCRSIVWCFCPDFASPEDLSSRRRYFLWSDQRFVAFLGSRTSGPVSWI